MKGEKKKLLIIAGVLVGLVVLVTIILLVFHALTNTKMTYSKLEEEVLSASKKYYTENKKLLPENGKQISITDSTLTAAGFLKNMSELAKPLNASCTAEVFVTNNNGSYRYTPILNCGDKYNTKTLTGYITSKGTVVSGEGLYQLNGELVYRGERPNNYVKISGKMFRIVKITDNKALLIYDEKTESIIWDNRYNIERKFSDGINDYSVSRIYDNTVAFDEIKESDMELFAKQTLYTGKRGEADVYNDGSIEKTNILENQVFGLLPLYDYINASIDENCISAKTRSCSNYNYLNKYDYNWWTITGDTDTTYKVYRVADNGSIDLIRANSYGYLRPTVLLESDVLYVSGDGSYEKPYIVK